MPRFTVAHRYASSRDGQVFGPWVAGETVELDVADAEWVLRDSPGALKSEKPAEKPAEREKPAGRDRQHRGGANRGA